MTSQILVDGSNVLFWMGGQVNDAVPERVVKALRARRFHPQVHFDNSIERHMTPDALNSIAAVAQLIIAPRGTSADEMLLYASALERLQIVSNDRFRFWRKRFSGLRNSALVTGKIGKGGQVCFSKKLRSVPL